MSTARKTVSGAVARMTCARLCHHAALILGLSKFSADSASHVVVGLL